MTLIETLMALRSYCNQTGCFRKTDARWGHSVYMYEQNNTPLG